MNSGVLSPECTDAILQLFTLTYGQKVIGFALAQLLVLFFERWLGRTKSVKAASTLDLVSNGFKLGARKVRAAFIKPAQPGEDEDGSS